ncbi:MAG TPA: hypothetical protein VG841_05080 [Caulobacterales bacterium]|nr:hypothetical protein [Caulobacterales bacterium]
MTAIRPRINQVEELTRGIPLPFAPLALAHLRLIAETLLTVWTSLLADQAETLASGDEPEVTALIETRLNKLTATDRSWSQIVVHVARGAEAMNFNGAHLEKRPDLSIYLTDHDPQFPVIVECKIVDAPNGRDVASYCDNGVSRFVNGDYAWAKSEAFMMAYVRDASIVDETLVPHLKAKAKAKKDPFNLEHIDLAAAKSMLQSRHGRGFQYVGSATTPGPIVICHVWVSTQ